MVKGYSKTKGGGGESGLSPFFSLGALLFFWALFNYRILFQGHTFVLWDDAIFYHPLWKWGAGILDQGLIPLWNPGAGFGAPHLADPRMAVWYPPLRVFFLLFSPEDAFRWALVGHSLFGLLGFWVFNRSRGVSPGAALGGSLVFGFSTHAACLTWNPDLLFGFSWVPWVFDRGMRAAEGSRALLSFSLCAAMQMSSGFPILSGLTLGALALEMLIARRREIFNAGKRIQLEVLGFLAALLLAGIFNLAWALPFMEYVKHSTISTRMTMPQGLPLESLATWLNPFYMGHPLHRNLTIPFEISCYFMGIPALAAILWGIGSGKLRRLSWFLFFLWILLSLGETVWLAGWLKVLFPPYRWIVRSGYLMPLVVFQGARLSSQSVQAFIEGAGTGRQASGWVLLSAALTLAALFAGVPHDLWFLWAAPALLTLMAVPRIPSWGRWCLFLSAVALSLALPIRSLHFTMGKDYYRIAPKGFAALVLPGRIYHPHGALEALGAYSGNGLRDAFEKMKDSLASNFPLSFGRDELDFSDSLFLGSYLRWFALVEKIPPKFSDKVLNYLGVRYAVGERPSERWSRVEGVGEVPIFVSADTMKKWFSVPIVFPSGAWERDAAGIGDPKFDFSRFGWVSSAERAGNYQLRAVRETGRTANSVALEASGHGKAFLFSTETAYPGWSVEAGKARGVPEEVNHAFRGVVLENGQEKVTLVYRPTTFRLGCFLSLLVCGTWLVMGLRVMRTKDA